MVRDQVVTWRAQGRQVVDSLMPKPLIRAMMGLQVIGTVAEPTPIPITSQARLASVTPGMRGVIGLGVGHGHTLLAQQSATKRSRAHHSQT